MEQKQFEKLLDAIKNVEISQAVLYEKLTQMDHRLDRTNKRLDMANSEFEEIKKRVDRHDKIVGAIVIVVAILGTALKFKLI